MAQIEPYLHNLYRARPDFVYSVSRDFARSCQTPMLILPDDTASHPYQTSVDVAALAPKGESMVYPWREPPELKAKAIDQVRGFLRRINPWSQPDKTPDQTQGADPNNRGHTPAWRAASF
jgi:hypothetical protein